MINHDLIKKESIAHTIISSVSHPNVLIPVKVIIKDVKYQVDNPKYLVKIIKLYENLSFLKSTFMNMSFINGFGKRAKPFIFDPTKYKRVEEFENDISEEEEKYYIVVDSIMTWRFKHDMQVMFNKLQRYLIMRNISELRNNITRSFYSGDLKLDTKNNFDHRLKSMLGDKLFNNEKEFHDFVKHL
jgi:hypothetical protein